MEKNGIEWHWIFRKAINTLWYWRNRKWHSDGEETPLPLFCVEDILYSAKLIDVSIHKSTSEASRFFNSNQNPIAREFSTDPTGL